MKKISNYIKGFTLVELIIVVTILVILGTISFVSFQGYTKNTRDSNRLSTLQSIEKGLELYYIKSGNYPKPEGEISTGVIDNVELTYVGEIGKSISNLIKINKTPKDPLTGSDYVYGVTSNYKNYQVAGILEKEISMNPLFIQTFADNGDFRARVDGNYPGYIVYSSGTSKYIANIPSIIFNNTGSVNLLSTGTYYVVNKLANLPYNVRSEEKKVLNSKQIIKKLTNSNNSDIESIDITEVINGNKTINEVFTGTTLESFNIKGEDITDTNIVIDKIKKVLDKNTNTTIKSNTCATKPSYTGVTFVQGTPTMYNQAWQSTDETKPCYWTCGTGKVLSGDVCVSSSCTGIQPETINGVSTALSTIGGTWNYNTTPGTCTFTCSTNYTWDSNSSSCIADTRTSSCTSIPTYSTYNSVSSITQTWNGTEWFPSNVSVNNNTSSTTECRFKCDSGYSWNSSNGTCEKNSWNIGGWGSCSVSCGGGTQNRNVYCTNSNGDTLSDSVCIDSKPSTSQSCNTNSCSATISVTYGVFKPSCGGGVNVTSFYQSNCNGRTTCSLQAWGSVTDPCVGTPSNNSYINYYCSNGVSKTAYFCDGCSAELSCN